MNQPHNNNNNNRKDQQCKIYLAIDAISVVSLGILLLCVHDFGQPFKRGFYCDDDTIRYPHRDSTVSSGLCYALGSGVNLGLILILEYLSLLKENKSQNEGQNQAFPMKLYARRCYYKIIIWLFGAITSELFTDIAKMTAGRLRPHFIDVCKPLVHWRSEDKSLDEYCLLPESKYQYILDYTCQGRPEKIRDTRMSFMSGHSSYSAFSAAFAVFYIQSEMNVAEFGLFKHAIQVLLASAAFYTGLTRISDYKHHWQDVLAGLLQGTTVAALVSLRLRPAYMNSQTKHINRNGRVSNEVSNELNTVGP